MERATGDKQHVIGFHGAVFGGHRCALNQGQQISLYAFAGYIPAAYVLARGDLVDLIDKHNPVLLNKLQRVCDDAILIKQFI